VLFGVYGTASETVRNSSQLSVDSLQFRTRARLTTEDAEEESCELKVKVES